jgi:hypothetical protein
VVGGLGCVGKKTTLLQAEASACVSGLANVLFCALAIFIFLFCLLSSKLSAVSLSFTLVHNVLRYEKLPISGDFLSSYTNVEAGYNL